MIVLIPCIYQLIALCIHFSWTSMVGMCVTGPITLIAELGAGEREVTEFHDLLTAVRGHEFH